MTDDHRKRLVSLVKARSLRYGDFTLSSGARSHFYLDLRKLTLSHDLTAIVNSLLLEPLAGIPFDAVGGPESGANQVVGGIMVVLHHHGCDPRRGFAVRKAEKGHGAGGLIVGELEPGDRCVLVEDVATTGASLLRAARAVEAAGGHIVMTTAIVDRLEGAGDLLGANHFPFQPLLTLDDLDIRPPAPGANP